MPEITQEHMEAGYQIATNVWGQATQCAIDLLRTLIRELEEGKLPPMCGVCALNFAAETLQKINEKQRAMRPDEAMHMMEPKGNA